MAIQAQLPSRDRQDWVMDSSSSCGGANNFYYNLQQQQQLLLQQQLQQQLNMQAQQNLCNKFLVPSTTKNNINNSVPLSFCQKMAFLDVKQRQEIDEHIRLQDERLRLLLQEQRRQQIELLLKDAESRALPLLRQKDMEIAQARNREMKLQDFLMKLENENQLWQRLAQENETMVKSLNNEIEQVKKQAASRLEYGITKNTDSNGGGGAEDAESCCYFERKAEEKTEEKTEQEKNGGFGFIDCDEERELSVRCRACKSRNSSVLFLPCWHLSSCNACEALLQFCPLCYAPRNATIEALMG